MNSIWSLYKMKYLLFYSKGISFNDISINVDSLSIDFE